MAGRWRGDGGAMAGRWRAAMASGDGERRLVTTSVRELATIQRRRARHMLLRGRWCGSARGATRLALH